MPWRGRCTGRTIGSSYRAGKGLAMQLQAMARRRVEPRGSREIEMSEGRLSFGECPMSGSTSCHGLPGHFEHNLLERPLKEDRADGGGYDETRVPRVRRFNDRLA